MIQMMKVTFFDNLFNTFHIFICSMSPIKHDTSNRYYFSNCYQARTQIGRNLGNLQGNEGRPGDAPKYSLVLKYLIATFTSKCGILGDVELAVSHISECLQYCIIPIYNSLEKRINTMESAIIATGHSLDEVLDKLHKDEKDHKIGRKEMENIFDNIVINSNGMQNHRNVR